MIYYVPEILVEYLKQPNAKLEPKVLVTKPPDWKSSIVSYLKEGAPTSTNTKSIKLKIKAARYTLISEVLYKKSFSFPYLRCLGQDEAKYILRKIHEGICRQHLGN